MTHDETASADPVTRPFFLLEADGDLRATFHLAALTSEVEIVGPPGGAAPAPPPTRRVRPTVTLTRRHESDMRLFAWHQAVVAGPLTAARKNCTMAIFDASGLLLARYRLELAWPLKIQITPGVFGGEDVVLETIVLTCEGVQRLSTG